MSSNNNNSTFKTRSNSNSDSNLNLNQNLNNLNNPNLMIDTNNSNKNSSASTNILTPPHETPHHTSIAAVQKIFSESTIKPKIDFNNPPKILKKPVKCQRNSLNTLMSAIKKLENANNTNAFKANRKNSNLRTINQLINEQIYKIEQNVLNNNNFEENINLNTLNELTINLQNTVHERIMGLQSQHMHFENASIQDEAFSNKLPRPNVPNSLPQPIQPHPQLESPFIYNYGNDTNFDSIRGINNNQKSLVNFNTHSNVNLSNKNIPYSMKNNTILYSSGKNDSVIMHNNGNSNHFNNIPSYYNKIYNNDLTSNNIQNFQDKSFNSSNSNSDNSGQQLNGNKNLSSVDTVSNGSPFISPSNVSPTNAITTPTKQIVHSLATYSNNNAFKDNNIEASNDAKKVSNQIAFDVKTPERNFINVMRTPNINNPIQRTPNLQLIGNSYTLFPRNDENSNNGKNMIVIPAIEDSETEFDKNNKSQLQRSSSVSSVGKTVSVDDSVNTTDNDEPKKCFHCQSSNTPEWRTGPYGKKNICNACGLFYRKLLMKFGVEGASLLMNYRRLTCSTNRKVPAFIQIPKDFFK